MYYSCLARGPNLFGRKSEELGLIRDALGEFPLVGFFCNGEIGPVRSKNFLHGFTATMALVGSMG